MPLEATNIATINSSGPQEGKKIIDDYSIILDRLGLDYKHVEYYWQVGEIEQVQGWILHLSVVWSQIVSLTDIVIPLLLENAIPFKIVKDKDTANSLLNGEFGQSQVGKVISIYPANVGQTVALAKQLIPLTDAFKGPAIPTDIHLGGILYTRYGSFNPIIRPDTSGRTVKLIYDAQGQLIPDTQHIPFVLLNGIEWPFSEMASPIVPKPKNVFHDIYKPIQILKSDTKGNVIKSLYLKNHFFVKWCVIKQGKKNMWVDGAGRDITDRLAWQKVLYEQLHDMVPLPKILDFFVEQGDTHLAMEFIKGPSLYECILELNSKCNSWGLLSLKSRLFILDRLLEMIEIIERIHQKGFVHRDITPVNFLVNKKNKLFLIDIELAYSLREKIPHPPFELGTNGFMSPEQLAVKIPTIKEDIYGLGATLITLLIGLPPMCFSISNKALLRDNLYFFLRNNDIVELIASCLDRDPAMRPIVRHIYDVVQKYKVSCQQNKVEGKGLVDPDMITGDRLQSLINGAIKGLVSPPTVISKDLWQSRIPLKDGMADAQRKEFGKSVGLSEGISGVLYFLARAKAAGFNIDSCRKAFDTGWAYIKEKHVEELPNTAPGLFGGAAGTALAMANGMNAGLLEDNKENRLWIKNYLELPAVGLDIATGAAGQGIAALQCRDYLEEDILGEIIKSHVERLLTYRQKDGYWVIFQDGTGKKAPAASFAYGNSGIIWFLLEYAARYKDQSILDIAIQSLTALSKLAGLFRRIIKNNGYRRVIENPQTSDGIPGIILTFIKAYETVGDPQFKEMAEQMLANYPTCLVHENFSQDLGLSGMGELYLEAYRVFKNKEWNERSEWLVQFFAHTSRKGPDGSFHWLSNNAQFPTADFMVGSSGIIHFLIRYLTQGKLQYRLLR